MKYLLTEYLGLDREMIRRTKKLKSRAVCMYKHYPQFLLSERDIFLLILKIEKLSKSFINF